MILGRDMYDFTDKILLHRGKALTEHLILRLQDYGYQGVYIDDELTNDLEIEEIISMELRTKALAAIQELDVDGVRDIRKGDRGQYLTVRDSVTGYDRSALV